MIGNDWDTILQDELSKPYFKKLELFLEKEYQEHEVYPKKEDVFNAFRYTPFKEVKAVILGQDPYHEPGQAHGLAFSVPENIAKPPSLANILKELDSDSSALRNENASTEEGLLVPWAKQGVLLLNTVLTVRAHEAGSHRNMGWETFTDAVITKLAEGDKPIAFVLWGAPAGRKKDLILEAGRRSGTRHLIITAPHPSPLSAYRGFFGGRYFSRINFFLEDQGEKMVQW